MQRCSLTRSLTRSLAHSRCHQLGPNRQKPTVTCYLETLASTAKNKCLFLGPRPGLGFILRYPVKLPDFGGCPSHQHTGRRSDCWSWSSLTHSRSLTHSLTHLGQQLHHVPRAHTHLALLLRLEVVQHLVDLGHRERLVVQ